ETPGSPPRLTLGRARAVHRMCVRPGPRRIRSHRGGGAPEDRRVGTYEELVAEGAAAPVEGWDFSWLDGRATEQRPSWGYQRTIAERLPRAGAALDVQTGGGEVLAGVPVH